MTWEQTIEYIRTKPEYNDLVEKAYFDEDIKLNVERFRNSEEYKETLLLLKEFSPSAKTILDVGSGNGISAISFALDGYKVTATEPDKSDTVGAGAIRKLKKEFELTDLDVYEEFAEDINFSNTTFDVIYVRQAMHHAYNLNQFVGNIAKLLKPGGILLTARDHVIYDQKDKDWFFESHPLHKFYGGENAFTAAEYKSAITGAGLTIIKELKYYDSVINYYPASIETLKNFKKGQCDLLRAMLKKKIGFLANIPLVFKWYQQKNKNFLLLDEKNTAGRMYSYLSKK